MLKGEVRGNGLIGAIREKKGMTQDYVAAELRTHKLSVSRWERGEVQPHNGNLERYAQLLGLEPARLKRLWLKMRKRYLTDAA